jgi:protein SCO1/2
MSSRLAAVVALSVVALAAGCGGGGSKSDPAASTAGGPTLKGTALVPPLRTHDFDLRDQSGKLVSLSAQRGRWVVLTFLYTHCPDVCPLIADQLNLALQRLGPQGRKTMRVIAVSVDPRRDTEAAIRHFVAAHALLPQFRFLTGTRARLAPVWRAYHIAATPNGKTVSHSAFEILIDPAGRGRVIYDSQVKGGDVIHDLRALGDTQASA